MTKRTLYQARFRGLKIKGEYSTNVLKCDVTMYLFSTRLAPHLYRIYWTPREDSPPVMRRAVELQTAKDLVRRMFFEQLTEWERV